MDYSDFSCLLSSNKPRISLSTRIHEMQGLFAPDLQSGPTNWQTTFVKWRYSWINSNTSRESSSFSFLHKFPLLFLLLSPLFSRRFTLAIEHSFRRFVDALLQLLVPLDLKAVTMLRQVLRSKPFNPSIWEAWAQVPVHLFVKMDETLRT